MIKNLFDIILSVVLLIILWPIIFISFLLASISTKSLGWFSQTRVGKNGKPFTIYKLQSMINGKVTTTGKFLRKSKFDELPQLLNILKGDMSFVGPRPDVPGYYDKLKGDKRKVLELKPGLTSLAAIKYRNEEYLLDQQENPEYFNDEVLFPDKVKMNLEYLEKRSFFYDLKIIFLTVSSLFK